MLGVTVKSTEEILRWKSNQLSMLLEISNTLANTHEMEALFQKIVDSGAQIMNLGSAALYSLTDDGMLCLEATFPALPEDFPASMKVVSIAAHLNIQKVVSTQKAVIVADTLTAKLTRAEKAVVASRDLRSLLFVPLCNQDHAIGVLIVGSSSSIHKFSADEIDVCHALANQAALEIERTKLAQEKQEHIHQIEEHILRQEQVERSLYASERRYRHLAENALDIIYRLQIITHVGTDSSPFFALKHSRRLGRQNFSGDRMKDVDVSSIEFGVTSLGPKSAPTPPRCAIEYISPSVQSITGYSPETILKDIHFCLGVIHPADLAQLQQMGHDFVSDQPLTTRVQCKDGETIWLEHRIAPLLDDDGNLVALEGIARDVTDRKRAEEVLHKAYDELNHAYSATIESLTRSLELRDFETKGHCRRVVDLTMKLAEVMGIPEDELPSIERGALLHDIGKIGIPDAILLKPGSLTDVERQIMCRHPQLAYDILYPIEYLRPALVIPLYHHEKFDGSGYPYGHKGESIPLAARIFAVVDVYDALISNRPYREAWAEAEALRHIQQQKGRHFDPAVVNAYLAMMRQYDVSSSLGGS